MHYECVSLAWSHVPQQRSSPPSRCFDFTYLVCITLHATTTGLWITMVTYTRKRHLNWKVLDHPPHSEMCPVSIQDGMAQKLRLQVVLRPGEAEQGHLYTSNNSGNAEFPAVVADPNQSRRFTSCRLLQSLEQITAYLISSTMAVDLKGISLSGGNQCQIEPLHALVHP